MLLSVRDQVVFSGAVPAENDDYYTVAIIMIKTKKTATRNAVYFKNHSKTNYNCLHTQIKTDVK